MSKEQQHYLIEDLLASKKILEPHNSREFEPDSFLDWHSKRAKYLEKLLGLEDETRDTSI